MGPFSALALSFALLISSALAATPTPTATTPPAFTATSLPALFSQLPSCAVSCFNTAALAVNCGPTDFACICSSSNGPQLGINIASCLSGGQLFGDDSSNPDDGKDGCSLSQLSSLGAEICAVYATDPTNTQLAGATSIISAALASQTITNTVPPGPSATKKNGAGKVGNTAAGMLGAVVAFAVLAL